MRSDVRRAVYDERYSRYIAGKRRLTWIYRYNDHFLFNHVLRYLRPGPRDRVLEVGCDQGYLLAELARHCGAVAGVDVNPDAVERCLSRGLDARCMAADRLAFSDGEFDHLVSVHTIEHVPDLPAALAEMRRVTAPSGRIVLLYPFEIIRGITELPSAIFVFRDLSMARRSHLHKLNPSRLARLAAGVGLAVCASELLFLPNPVFPTWVTVLQRS